MSLSSGRYAFTLLAHLCWLAWLWTGTATIRSAIDEGLRSGPCLPETLKTHYKMLYNVLTVLQVEREAGVRCRAAPAVAAAAVSS